jgi:hypothetical protein
VVGVAGEVAGEERLVDALLQTVMAGPDSYRSLSTTVDARGSRGIWHDGFRAPLHDNFSWPQLVTRLGCSTWLRIRSGGHGGLGRWVDAGAV